MSVSVLGISSWLRIEMFRSTIPSPYKRICDTTCFLYPDFNAAARASFVWAWLGRLSSSSSSFWADEIRS